MNQRRSAFGLVLLFALVAVATTAGLSWAYWDALTGDSGETARNVGLLAGGIVAIALALWRSSIAERQVTAAEVGSLDEQFQRAAEMLGHEDVSVRIGGVASLRYLAMNHFDRYGERVIRILDHFMESRRHQRNAQVSGPAFGIELAVGATHPLLQGYRRRTGSV